MQSIKKITLFFIFSVLGAVTLFAQQQYVTINGTFTEKADAEISIGSKTAGRPRLEAIYILDRSNNNFSFQLPFSLLAEYSISIKTMKQGHMRLEADKYSGLALKLTPGKVMSLKVTPSAFGQEKSTPIVIAENTNIPYVTITGNLYNWKYGGAVFLSKVVDGELHPVQQYNVDKDSTVFYIHAPVTQEGFYYISSLRWKKRIYVKPNDILEMNVEGRGGNIQWIKTTAENQQMYQWQQLSAPITNYGYGNTTVDYSNISLDTFTHNYQQLQPTITNFISSVSGNNKKFNRLFKSAVNLDNQLTALNLLFNLSVKVTKGFRPSPKEFINVPDYFKNLLVAHAITDPAIMQTAEGKEYLNLYSKFSLLQLSENEISKLDLGEKLQSMMYAINNDTLKSYFLKEQLGVLPVNNLSEFKQVFTVQSKYATLPSVKKAYDRVYGQFANDTTFIGKSAYDFSLPDTTGKIVSMKDFKGKVILIDVWATWCGPCKAQFPFLKAIEEEYHDNKNIVFVGISLDKVEVKQKWLDLIRKEQLQGVQLLDDFGKTFGRKYGLNAIPRFMLIDKQGKWIEIHCPLPETKESLKKYLDRALQQ